MIGNENRLGVTENRGREPIQSQSKKKRNQSKSCESSSWERVMQDMGERLKIVKHNIDTLQDHILEQLDSLKENVQACLDTDTLRDDCSTRLEAKVMDALQAMQISIETLREDLAVCKKATTIGGASTSMVSPRVDYPKPNGFDGRRDAKKVENFLWQMERYFEGLNLTDEASRVRTATLYLTDTAFLWWRKKHADIERDFTTIMLQILNLSEEDLLLHFMDDIKSVDETIAVTESLTQYQPHTDASKKKKKWNSTKGDRNPSRKEYEEKKHAFVPKRGRFMCKGPHPMSNCPKLGFLSAMLLPATSSKGLMYMKAYISGKPTKALVNTGGATHNFITEEEANRLGLRWSRGKGWLKTVNAKAQPLNGVVKNVELRLGTWKGQVDFSMAPMDDFKVVLSMDFLRNVTAIHMPSFSFVCILEKGAPYMIPTIDPTEGHSQGTKAESRHLSVMQITKGVKWGEPTYLATLKEKVPAVTKEEELPPIIQNVLEKNKDVMPDELPKKLLPKREIDHKIELELGTKPPAIAPYRMAPPELEELRRQLIELLDTGWIRPSKAPYGAPVFSRELKKLAVEGKTKQLWVEDGLLYTKGQCLYATYFWPHMRDSVDLYVKTYLVCQ
ncbi:hypothetical protein Pfo_025688 [Paulownia fortunei]|nr:hypothetical protein Pfo_025688 [Paulownia fortunei]